MKRNINSVSLISKKGIARIVKILFKVKLEALVDSVQLYHKGIFPTHFLGIFRVFDLLSNCFEKIAKDYTTKKLLCYRLRKYLKIR